MLNSIKWYAGRGLASIAGIAMFVILLPLTIAATLVMLLVGATTLGALRHRMKKAGKVDWNADNRDTTSTQRPPIEGSYTVIHKGEAQHSQV